MCAMPVFNPLLSNPPPYKEQMEGEPEVEVKTARWKAREIYSIADSDERVQGLLENINSSKKREFEDYTDLMAQMLRQRELACKWVDEAGKFIETLKKMNLEMKEKAKQPAEIKLESRVDEKKYAELLVQKCNLERAMGETVQRCLDYYHRHCMRRRPDSTTLQQVASALALPKGALEEFLQQDQASLPNINQEIKIMKAICVNMNVEWEKVKIEMAPFRQHKSYMGESLSFAANWVLSGVSWAWSNTPSLSHIFSRNAFPKPVEVAQMDRQFPQMPEPSAPPLPVEGQVEVVVCTGTGASKEKVVL